VNANATHPHKGTYMGGFVAPKLDTIKVAIIRCGARGGTHYNHVSAFEGTEIVGICDLYEDLCEKAKKKVLENGKGTRHLGVKLYHGDKYAYKRANCSTKTSMKVTSGPQSPRFPSNRSKKTACHRTSLILPADNGKPPIRSQLLVNHYLG
jgi:hypothetical protein